MERLPSSPLVGEDTGGGVRHTLPPILTFPHKGEGTFTSPCQPLTGEDVGGEKAGVSGHKGANTRYVIRATQRPHRFGWSGCRPTSSHQCQQRTHFNPGARRTWTFSLGMASLAVASAGASSA